LGDKSTYLERTSAQAIFQRKHEEEGKEGAVELAEILPVTKLPRKKGSSVLFYISSMGWFRFLIFVFLVGIEVITNGMQSE
jgi:hypothetical protein